MKTDRKALSVEKCKDSGLALVLVALLCYEASKRPVFIPIAITLLLIVMTYPSIYAPFAKFWFWLSTTLGTVVSKVVLTALFVGVVLPTGLVRRLRGRDAMQLQRWRSGRESVLRVRDHRFTAGDLEHPY